MKQNKKQLQKEQEYFEKMKDFIIEDIKDGRDASALAGSIARSIETLYKYMRLWSIKDLYGMPEELSTSPIDCTNRHNSI